jgi:DNA processing protein
MSRACRPCLNRAWLLGALSGHLEAVRSQIGEVLSLGDHELIAAVAGRRRRELERRFAKVRSGPMPTAMRAPGLETICRCNAGYPSRLRELPAPPAVLYVAGGLERFLAAVADEPVAVVGARHASSYGVEVAGSLGRGLAAAELTVVSGMAVGIDSSAHEGALSADGVSVAVLPGSADDRYPRSRRRLYRHLIDTGAAVSEVPPQTSVRRWMFIARNRIIAALSAAMVVVEAGDRSGALVTAAVGRALGRPVGAVPGRVTSVQAAGTNALLADGAFMVRGAQDVLDAVFGAGVRSAASADRPPLTAEARDVLDAVAAGSDSADALAGESIPPGRTLATLGWLELSGYIRRQPGGRFAVIP